MTTSGPERVGNAVAMLTLLAIAISLLFVQSRLHSLRPDVPETHFRGTFGVEDVPARLWQDPLLAMYAHPELVDEGATHARGHRLTSLAGISVNMFKKVQGNAPGLIE